MAILCHSEDLSEYEETKNAKKLRKLFQNKILREKTRPT